MFNKKRILAIVMSLMMVVSLVPGLAFADGTPELKFNGGVTSITVEEGEIFTLMPELTGVPDGQVYHIHFEKNQGGKQAFNFVDENGNTSGGPIKYDSTETFGVIGNNSSKSGASLKATACAGTKEECTNNTLAVVSKISVKATKPDGYTWQGDGRGIKVVSPSKITLISEGATECINSFDDKVNAKEKFEFIFEVNGGVNNQYSEEGFKESAVSKIFVYDETMSTVVASAAQGNMSFNGRTGTGGFIMSVAEGALEPGSNYVLVFDKAFATKPEEATSRPLGLDVKFNFTTGKASVANVTVDPIADQTYTGSAITPAVVVKGGDKTLTKDVDYTVAYANNVEVGTATVTITGMGKYEGTKDATFTIVAPPAGGDDTQKPGDNSGNTPADKNNTDKTTQTGDMNMMPYFMIMLAAMAVAGGTVVYRRQRQ